MFFSLLVSDNAIDSFMFLCDDVPIRNIMPVFLYPSKLIAKVQKKYNLRKSFLFFLLVCM